VSLRFVEHIDSPFAAGWWRPIVFLPVAMLTQMPASLIEALLAHELAHIRRHDYAINLMQRVIEAALFYHPVVWWLSGRIRIEREMVADNICAHVLGTPLPLARALVVLAEDQRGRASVYGGLAQPATGGVLRARIEALVRPASGKRFWPLEAGWLSIGLLAFSIAWYGQTQLALGRQRIQNPFNSQLALPSESPVPADPALPSVVLLSGDQERSLFWGAPENVAASKMHRRTARPALRVRAGDKTYLVTEPRLLSQAALAWQEATALTLQIDVPDDQLRTRHTPCARLIVAVILRMEGVQMRSSPAFIEQASIVVHAREGQTAREVDADLGVDFYDVERWLKVHTVVRNDVAEKERHPHEWRREAQLGALLETHALNEDELHAWCRERGLFQDHPAEWRASF
ncbi:MAG: M56 family metallopeptidase, partial [Sideroxyarcus sp.]|nr:M56 family metallopeptidase [Sideroxyarcus sp.]